MNRRITVIALLALVSGRAFGQDSARGPLVTRSDALLLGSAALGSTVLIGWDRQISTSIRESALRRDRGVGVVMDVARFAGQEGSFLAGAGLWLSGRVSHDRTRERLGLRSLEAIVASGAVTSAVKALVGRARPDQSPGAPRDFVLGRGFGDRSEFQSFPSGHATAAFAFASAIDAELDRIAPRHPGWIVPLLYGLAAGTAASRVYHDRHWASDVVAGSAIGFVGGRAVVRWHADRR